jgi:hypothetical protein
MNYGLGKQEFESINQILAKHNKFSSLHICCEWQMNTNARIEVLEISKLQAAFSNRLKYDPHYSGRQWKRPIEITSIQFQHKISLM